MKQISTGAGLVALSVGMVATAFIASHRSGGEAFAQGTVGERRIAAFATSVDMGGAHWAFRLWSDNVLEARYIGRSCDDGRGSLQISQCGSNLLGVWHAVDNGLNAFLSADVDRSGEVNAGDVSSVLLDFGSTTDPSAPPPIDCNINAPR